MDPKLLSDTWSIKKPFIIGSIVIIGYLIDQKALYYWIHSYYRILDRSKSHLLMDPKLLSDTWSIKKPFINGSIVIIGYLIDQKALYYWIHSYYRILDRSKSHLLMDPKLLSDTWLIKKPFVNGSEVIIGYLIDQKAIC